MNGTASPARSWKRNFGPYAMPSITKPPLAV